MTPGYVLYRLAPRDNGKTDKIPVNVEGGAIDAQNPANWLSETDARAYANVLDLGVGVVITPESKLFALDLDGAHDGIAWAPYVQPILNAFPGAYTEVSVSGRGLHVIGSYTGERPAHGTRCAEIRGELYTGGRFIALGQPFGNGSMAADHTAGLAWLLPRFPAREVTPDAEWTDSPVPGHGITDDAELVQRALRSRSAASTFGGAVSFADLWECNADKLTAAFPPQTAGTTYDGSGADLALASHLSFWTGGNCEQIARLMRASGLARGKHDREDYMRSTVLRACAGRTAWYSARSAPTAPLPAAVVPPAPTDHAAVGAVHVPVAYGRDGKYDATLPNLEYALTGQSGWRFALDRFRDCVMVCSPGGAEWLAVSEDHVIELRTLLEKIHRYKPISDRLMRDALRLVALREQFDSAQDWLRALVWDGVPRVARFLAGYCGAADDEYSAAVSRYVWTGLANRVLVPGCQLDMVVALVSPQGRQKSTGLAELAPHPDFFSDSVSFLGDGDDFKRMIRGKLVIELAELAGLSRAELEHVKVLITRRREQWVEKWQVLQTTFDRRCMLFATTNDERFLPPDETGNRRWLPVVTGTLDRARIAADRAQLWAEGAAIYTATGQAWQDAERLATARHAQHEARDVWTDSIQRWLVTPVTVSGAPAGPAPGLSPFTASDVLSKALGVGLQQMDSRNEKRVARTLRQLGYESKPVRINGAVVKRWIKQ